MWKVPANAVLGSSSLRNYGNRVSTILIFSCEPSRYFDAGIFATFYKTTGEKPAKQTRLVIRSPSASSIYTPSTDSEIRRTSA